MIKLFNRVSDGNKIITEYLSGHLRALSKVLVKVQDGSFVNAIVYIQNFLDLKEEFESLAFSNDKYIQQVIYSELEYFFNLNPWSPEYLSLFIDNKLKNGVKNFGDAEVESILQKSVILYRYIIQDSFLTVFWTSKGI